MAQNLISSLLSLATNLLPSIIASAHAPSSSSSNNSEKARAVEEDLERLMRTLERIKATLYDAEEREIIDHSVKLWLKELKKVAYDAEDVLSEYHYEVTRVQVEARNGYEASSSHKRKQIESIEYIVPIPDDMVDRLIKIRSRFDEITKDREALQLRESDGVRRLNKKNLRPLTGHMVDEASIFGRGAAITEVINFLLPKKEKEEDKLFSVISIVGKGGIGKTSIAQLVYKDGRVSQCFDLFGWVCVSEEFDVMRLIKATIESISKHNCGVSELSPLQEKLGKIVKRKRILLVLDDVWNEDQSLWESFRVSFKEAKMVRILVTTRHEKVANIMQTTASFWPTILPEDLCWQLFQHYAFSGTSDNAKHLVDMGRNIIRKCGGLPLALKSIASLLRYETDEKGWREILESELWESNASNDIFPALQISYAHLPVHLKPCFLFCSMYPKDYLLKKIDLMELWICSGYIESKGKRKITEIAVEYCEELKQRSFLDDFSSDEYCKLHDIIHDLARLNSDKEHYSVEINNQPLNSQNRNVTQEVYHLYARAFKGCGNQILQQNLEGLRTLSMDHVYHPKELEGILTKIESLKVLKLEGYFKEIPHSIFKLKHLTYLGVASFKLETLPLSIGLLYNLRALILCSNRLEYLPECIGDLANLEFLHIKSSYLRNLPKSLCKLSNLLRLVIVDKFFDYDLGDKPFDYVPHGLVNFPAIKTMKAWLNVGTIGWLKDMTDLEGYLSINGVSNLKDAQRSNIRNKCKLETLDLCWYRELYMSNLQSGLMLILKPDASDDDWVGVDDAEFSWLESLQPHPNLKKLRVRYYSSATVPGWMSDPSSLQSIQEVLLEGCYNIQSLPFHNLHTLKHLTIDRCHSIRALQLEQLPSQLEELHIAGCNILELITGLGNLDMLATLKISGCKVLKSIMMDGLQLVDFTEPFGDFSHEKPRIGRQSISSLTTLEITRCKLLRVLPDGLIPSGHCNVRVSSCGCPGLEIGQLSASFNEVFLSPRSSMYFVNPR